MNIVGSVKEDLVKEKRISITPETVKKYTDLGFNINIEKEYAEHLGINDEEYGKVGAKINISKEEILEKSDIILKVDGPSAAETKLIKSKSILISQFDPSLYQD